jgi:hypothetical protein
MVLTHTANRRFSDPAGLSSTNHWLQAFWSVLEDTG